MMLSAFGPCLQGYAIGNPSTDGSTNYNENGVYKGFNLISQNLFDTLNDFDCPGSSGNYNASDPNGNATAGLDGEHSCCRRDAARALLAWLVGRGGAHFSKKGSGE